MADIGTGTTLDFSTWSATSEIISIEISGMSRDNSESSTLATTGGKTFIPGDLYDPGTIEIEYLVDGDNLGADVPPITGAPATLTITLPLNGTTHANSGVFTAAAFLSEWGMSIPLEDRVTATGTFKLSGTAGWADAT